MEYGHNLAKDGTTSVKVHHQPGGASNFSLGHDGGEDDDRWGNKAKKQQEEAKQPVQQQQQQQES